MNLNEYHRLILSAMTKLRLMGAQIRNKNVANKVELSSEEIEAVLLTLEKLGIK